ncbi:MAG: L-threonylcarbamoyladenylate synthase [Rhodospirillales bacterium]
MTSPPATAAIVQPDAPDAIDAAARRLRDGKLVAFPTETVYGLGADATNDRAVAAIFDAKQRPAFNPLICHFPSTDAVLRSMRLPDAALDLAKRFWPGSLSIVATRPVDCPISRLASAGLDTVAVRVPDHQVARRLLEATGRPIAAPSANLSGRLSPTRATDVIASLGNVDLLILDGGACRVGLESTVVAVRPDGRIELLREGGISREDLEHVSKQSVSPVSDPDEVRAPGMLARHYQPRIPLRIDATEAQAGEIVIGFGPMSANMPKANLNLSPTGDLREAAANLFAMLHDAETGGARAIAVTPIPDEGLGRAINDRLKRGASGTR